LARESEGAALAQLPADDKGSTNARVVGTYGRKIALSL